MFRTLSSSANRINRFNCQRKLDLAVCQPPGAEIPLSDLRSLCFIARKDTLYASSIATLLQLALIARHRMAP